MGPDELYDAVMAFCDKYEEELDLAPDESVLGVIETLRLALGDDVEGDDKDYLILMALYVLCDMYATDESLKEENK